MRIRSETTSASTDIEEKLLDFSQLDDGNLPKRMGKNVSKRTHNPEWSYTPKSKQVDDGKHWQPGPGPFRRDE